MANNDKENKIEKFTKEAIGKTLNQFNKEIGIADLVEINKNQDRILNGILSQVNDENTEKTEKSNIITLDNSTDGIVELKEIQGDTNVNVSKIEEMPITHDIGDKEGNVFSLNEITQGAISIGEIQGNTMVNCNKDDKKELVLMKDLATQGDNNVTLTEGVDGGLVDVALEGNTMVNVCEQKDPVAITKSYTVETGNHVALQGEYDGKCRPVVTGNTLVNLYDVNCISTSGQCTVSGNKIICTTTTNQYSNFFMTNKTLFKPSTEYTLIINITKNSLSSTDKINLLCTGDVDDVFSTNYNILGGTTGTIITKQLTKSNLSLGQYGLRSYIDNASLIEGHEVELSITVLEGDYTNKPIPSYFEGLQSSFEDNLVTQEMVDNGEELAENLGKYKVDYVISKENGTIGQTKTFYLNSPLLEGDTIEQQGDNVVHVHRSEIRAYETDDELTLPTDMTNTLVAKATPQYEVISQNDTILCDSYTNGHLDVDSVVPIEKVDFLHFEKDLTYLYANTQYAVQFVSDAVSKVDITLGGAKLLNQDVKVGTNKYTITTPSELIDNNLVLNGEGFNASNIVVTEATDQDFGYFEGMKSVGECEGNIEILSHNGNLYKRLENSYYQTHGSNVIVIEDNEDSFVFEVNEWDKGISYLISTEGLFKNRKYKMTWEKYKELPIPQLHSSGITLLNSNKRFKEKVSLEKINNNDWDFELPNSLEQGDILQVRFKTRVASGQNGACNICINEIGVAKNTALSKLNTQRLTHEPLRAVGDIKDKYVLIDGKWYIERNCKQVNFKDIASSVVIADTTKTNTLRFKWRYTEELNFTSTTTGTGFKCDIFKYALYSSDEEGISIKEDIDVNILKSKLTSLDKTGVIQWLNNNPVNLTYIRKTPTYEPIDYNPFEVYSGTTHITTNSVIPTNITIKNHGFNCLLKPSTTYTVSSNQGINTVTTGADIGDSCLRFYDTDTSDKTTMKNVLVLEGDWTSKANLIPGNFNGIESCFEQEYDVEKGKYKVNAKVVGKNLFDINKTTVIGNILDKGSNYLIVNHAIIDISYCCNFNPNSQYTLSWELEKIENNNIAGFEFIYTDGTSNYTVSSIKGTLTSIPGKTISEIRITFDNFGKSKISNIQLEQGSKATVYEPYKESDVTFYIDEPLRRIGDSKDRVYIEDDKVIVQRNCKEEVFNETNTMGLVSTSDKIYRYALKSANKYKRGSIALSDKFPSDITNADFEHIRYDTNIPYSTSLQLYINKNKLTSSSELRNYLQSNPITVLGILAEPVYEEVEYSSNRLILNTFNNESFNNSTLFLDTNISPKLSFKPLYEELVYVKSNTKYYIQFNAVGSGEVVINLGGTELTTEIVEGYNCIPITTPSESTNLMTISGQGITISEVVVSEVICGGYYKGLQSCFEEHMENGKYRVLLRGITLDGSKVNGIKLYINEPLRGVENAKDRLCIKNGKLMVERKCGEEILDGSDSDTNLEAGGIDASTGKTWFNYKITNKNIINEYASLVECDTYKPNPMNSHTRTENNTIGGVYQTTLDLACIRIITEDFNEFQDFKDYLKQNQVKVVYKLQTPIYEEATNEYGLPIVFEGYENGVVYIDSAVTPTTHIKYTSNNQLATTLSEAEEQNIATQEDINMNVITYMMDIDMILTDMEMSNDISVMAVRRDSSNENMLDRMSEEDKKVYRDNTVVMLEKMITAKVLEKEDIEGRIDMYYNKNRISKEQYKYLKSLL